MSESLVDLLLVRLGREEEKKKVLKLLITSLDLSVTDAENAVNNSPSVIREAVPMSEARVIQKDLYPYIDLLPRFDDEADSIKKNTGDHQQVNSETSPVSDNNDETEETASDEIEEDYEEDSGAEIPDDLAFDEDEPSVEEDNVLITSANEEIISTQRCHICGRTPTDGENLAPCRTCGDLTCRDCFDRVAHVCTKCSASGKSVDYANDGVLPEKEHGLVFDADEEDSPDEHKGSSAIRYVAVAVLFIAALAALFYFADPMNLFGPGDPALAQNDVSDGLGSTEPDSLNSLDQVAVEDTLPSDTTEVVINIEPDTGDPVDDPFGVRSLVLGSEYSAITDPPSIDFRTRTPASVRAEIPLAETDLIADQMAVIAAWIPVELDDAAILVYHDTTAVLVLVLNHPVESESRMELMRRTAAWLSSSDIDQLVLYYTENRFQSTVVMSLVAEVFNDVQGVLNPSQFQSFLSYREDCWESLSGPVAHWLTDI